MAFDMVNFEQDVIEKSREIPVLVDFWAAWCGPCKILGPVLERLATASDGRWTLVKVNTEQHPQLAARYNIRSIPNVKLFIDGVVADEFAGALPEPMVLKWLDAALPDSQHQGIQQAIDHLQGGRLEQARGVLEALLAEQPHHEQACVLLARIVLTDNPRRAIELVDHIEADSDLFGNVESIRTIARLMQIDPAALPDSSAREPYLKAVEQLKGGKYRQALESFIEVLHHDRYFDEDGARKAIIAVFKTLGENHPLTREFRPIFSSALYV